VPGLAGEHKVPTADELRYDITKDRRKAKATFVILGE